MSVTVVIPSIPPRMNRLPIALLSVAEQTRLPDAISVAIDRDHEGPAKTRNRALDAATTEWVAFLDDDDSLNPNHIEALLAEAERTGADLVYPWFTVGGGADPFPQFFGEPWSNDAPHIFPITYLVRTELAKSVGGFPDPETDAWKWLDPANGVGEDWGFILRLIKADAKIVHLAERTWTWLHWGGNTSGTTWQ